VQAFVQKYIGPIGWFVTLAGTILAWFDGFTALPLFSRLFVVAVFTLATAVGGARWLARWCKDNAGNGPAWRVAASVLLLSGVCVGCVVLAHFFTDRFSLTYGPDGTTSNGLLVYASGRTIPHVRVPLPPGGGTNDCNFKDGNPTGPQLVAYPDNWDTQQRAVVIDGFVFPQVLAVVCGPPAAFVRQITTTPASTEIFGSDELAAWKHWEDAIGGLLWVIALVAFWRWSRR